MKLSVLGVFAFQANRTAMRDHSRILIRVSPDAAKDKGEIRLLFNWAEEFKQKLTKGKKQNF